MNTCRYNFTTPVKIVITLLSVIGKCSQKAALAAKKGDKTVALR